MVTFLLIAIFVVLLFIAYLLYEWFCIIAKNQKMGYEEIVKHLKHIEYLEHLKGGEKYDKRV